MTKKLLITLIAALAFLAPSLIVGGSVKNVPTSFPSNFSLSVPMGEIEGTTCVNKFGRAIAGVQTSATDIWDRADASETQSIWVAPTQAQLHYIRSTSESDDGPAGAGARTIDIYGLPTWGEREIIETVTINGTANVVTVSSFVIIHRMAVVTKGATSSNVGVIIASATVDGTVTAEINAGEGQTQMAIYGVPSIQDAYLTQYYASVNKSGGSVGTVNFRLLTNPEPDAQLTNFIIKHVIGTQSTGSSHFSHPFNPYKKFPGPCIIKIQGISNNADLEGSAGFDVILVDK
jgi:hypothetical protein